MKKFKKTVTEINNGAKDMGACITILPEDTNWMEL